MIITFTVHGQMFHLCRIKSDQKTKFMQLYIIGIVENEASIKSSIHPDTKLGLVQKWEWMLHYVNVYDVSDLKNTLKEWI